MRFKLVYTHEKQFDTEAYTLSSDCVGTNDSGWIITGEVKEDWFEWVNEFSAFHPEHGWVEGDFEAQVFATSKKAFKHFVMCHAPQRWDYYDI